MNTQSRRQFLAASVATTATILSPSSFAATTVTRTSWPSAGVKGSVSAQTTELHNLLKKGVPVLVKAGANAINALLLINDAIPFDITGEPGAIIQVMNDNLGAIRLYNCTSASITNLRFEWPSGGLETRPVRENLYPGIYAAGVSNLVIDNVTVVRPRGAGVLVLACNGPKVSNTTVRYTGADGIHFANCGAVVATNLTTSFTGDDGVAFVDYAHIPQPGGFTLVGAKISESIARGLAVVGAVRGTATDITIDGTSSNGIHIEQDVYYKTLFPSDITVRRVTVNRTGGTLPKVGNQFGINIVRATKVLLEDITITNGTSVGIFSNDSKTVILNNVRSTTSPNCGLKVINTHGLVLNNVRIANVVTQYAYIANSSNVTGDIDFTYSGSSNMPPVQILSTTGMKLDKLTFIGFPVNSLKFVSSNNSGTATVYDYLPVSLTALSTATPVKVTQTYNGVRQTTDALKVSFGL